MRRVKLVKQHESRDCGAACLCMICNWFGKKYSIQYLRKLTGTSQDGVSIWGMVEAADKLGLLAEGYSCDLDELKKFMDETDNPIVLHMKNNHFVVGCNSDNSYIYIMDPSIGKYRIAWDDLMDSWSGLFIRFDNTKAESVSIMEKDMCKYNLIWQLIKEHIPSLCMVIILSVISLSVTICSNYIFQMLIDSGGNLTVEYEHISTHNFFIRFLLIISNNNIYILLAHMIIFSAAMSGVVWIRGKYVSTISRKIDVSLINNYVKKICDSTMHDISTRMMGEYMSRMADLVAVRRIISDILVASILDSAMVLISIMIMYKINPTLLLVVIMGIVLYIVVAFLLKKEIKNTNYRIMNDNAEVQSYFKEFIQGMEVIKAYNECENVERKVNAKYAKYADSVYRGNMLGVKSNSLSTLVEQISGIIIIVVGFSFVNSKWISLGELFTFYLFMACMTEPIKDILSFQTVFQSGMVALDRIKDIYYMEDEKSGGALLPDSPMDIKMENVSFHYPGKTQLLNGITFHVHKKDKIVIMGENGCGKSTLIKLILGIEKVDCGSIIIDGMNIDTVNLTSLRGKVSYVAQTNFMFADTLRNNITFGNSGYSQQELDDACELAGLKNIINEMPMGYETYINEDGGNLSMGQKQAIAIARALIRKPQLLILDEATSNMDIERERLVLKNISNLSIPCIIISHSKNIHEFFDKEFVIENKKRGDS